VTDGWRRPIPTGAFAKHRPPPTGLQADPSSDWYPPLTFYDEKGAPMPGFIQIMEIKTSRIDEVRAFAKKMRAERGDALLATKSTITADRDRPGYYVIIVEFNSYEEAMKNSNDPATGEFAKQLTELLDGPPKFYNFDVLESD
jgi:hypothetical protein